MSHKRVNTLCLFFRNVVSHSVVFRTSKWSLRKLEVKLPTPRKTKHEPDSLIMNREQLHSRDQGVDALFEFVDAALFRVVCGL